MSDRGNAQGEIRFVQLQAWQFWILSKLRDSNNEQQKWGATSCRIFSIEEPLG